MSAFAKALNVRLSAGQTLDGPAEQSKDGSVAYLDTVAFQVVDVEDLRVEAVVVHGAASVVAAAEYWRWDHLESKTVVDEIVVMVDDMEIVDIGDDAVGLDASEDLRRTVLAVA